MRQEIEEALQGIRSALQADGGDIELVDVEDGVVKVRLKGACSGCPMAHVTMSQGVEKALKEAVPDVKEVVAVR